MIVPNKGRVLIKPVNISNLKSGIILSEEVNAGDNLLYGEVVHAGTTDFKKGQRVMYSQYSATALVDAKAIEEGDITLAEAKKQALVVLAQDDVMAYYDVK